MSVRIILLGHFFFLLLFEKTRTSRFPMHIRESFQSNNNIILLSKINISEANTIASGKHRSTTPQNIGFSSTNYKLTN